MQTNSKASQCEPGCGCSNVGENAALGRRQFLKALGLGTGALAWGSWPAMAGPFVRADFERLVPADKKLRPEWVKSLTARGERTVYRGRALEKIGMPVGGICSGQVYLGGDGRLWHWDIFNRRAATGPEHYAQPMAQTSPLKQGFALRITGNGTSRDVALDSTGFQNVSFIGEYPIGYVEYQDDEVPVTVRLEAFSPFIPLNTEDSSLPVTALTFTVTNHSQASLEIILAGSLENAVALHSAHERDGFRRNRLIRETGLLCLDCIAEDVPNPPPPERPDILFEDFEAAQYQNWESEGNAFGNGPIEISKIPPYQGDVGGKGRRVVNSHASAPGRTVEEKDAATGTLTSRPFTIARKYITFLIGGGAHKETTCINLLVDKEVVRTATGRNENRMYAEIWDVRNLEGKTGVLQIVDKATGGWGNIGLDDIVFSDRPGKPLPPFTEAEDLGSMGLALLDTAASDFGITGLPEKGMLAGLFSGTDAGRDPVRRPFPQRLIGGLGRKLNLASGGSAQVTFLLTWHMPNLRLNRLPPGRHYASRFDSALAVTRYVARNWERLSAQTRLWHDTWYDSSLPYWFLDRSFLNTSILATSTCYRFGNGRFYGWEGVGCCEGTCGHVWQYAHAVARLFPDLERMTREQVDFGLALQADGAIHFRGEFNDIPAIDAQAGTILRALREHQVSADDAFLKRNWTAVKQAMAWLLAKDSNGDGLIESNQHNTLDTDWYGPVAWLSGLYLAALSAAATMADEVGDQAFARQCRGILDLGRRNIVPRLFQGDYFVNQPDPNHLDAINSGTGCEIDQVLGQSWAFQVGLPRVLPENETVQALKSIWRYNFTPDVGPYRQAYKAGRWYAMPGEAGTLMCTFPRSDWDYDQAKGKGADWAAGYFNECMNGFEYQVAGHMIWEGLVTEGLAVTRAVHDRYHASRRNPWNEVECGDHYARSMASYGVFLAACGFQYHGPKGKLRFAPRLKAEDFKCAFTTAEGWGTYSQKIDSAKWTGELALRWGRLRLQSLELPVPEQVPIAALELRLATKPVPGTAKRIGNRVELDFTEPIELTANQELEIRLG